MARRCSLWLLMCFLAGCDEAAVKTPAEAKRLLRTTGCTNCHDKTRTLVGPAFTVIAARYAAQPDAEKTIAKSLVKGSSGKWGPTPMPPQPRLEPEEQRAMIAWILSLER